MAPLVHDRRGSGEPLILIHGLGARWQVWEPILDLLAPHHDVWSIDLPGFGSSPPFPPGETADIAALTRAVTAFAQEQGIEKPHVAGNSTGGGVVLELAARGAVRSATALSPIGFWSSRERAFCQASMRNARALAKATRPALPLLAGNPVTRTLLMAQFYARPWRLDPQGTVESTDDLIRSTSFDETCDAFTGYLAPEAAADKVPVTIAWGSRDRLLLPRQLNRARHRVPRARHVVLEGSGHVSMTDDPDGTARVILETASP
jgi:pimeloyl-ACP methyl ester carboxylesterase